MRELRVWLVYDEAGSVKNIVHNDYRTHIDSRPDESTIPAVVYDGVVDKIKMVIGNGFLEALLARLKLRGLLAHCQRLAVGLSRLADATAVFRRLIAADPSNALAYENLGMAQLQAKGNLTWGSVAKGVAQIGLNFLPYVGELKVVANMGKGPDGRWRALDGLIHQALGPSLLRHRCQSRWWAPVADRPRFTG